MADYSMIEAWLQREDDELLYESDLPMRPTPPDPGRGPSPDSPCRHNHLFVHWAGGTDLATEQSDDAYQCDCGVELRVTRLLPEDHFRMPSTISFCLEDRPPPLDASED